MDRFLAAWASAAMTSIGFFWMALWAFVLGYLISSLIQVLVTRQGMKDAMGESGPKSMGLATFFGFISSSCSFAALSTTRALFKKGAGLAPALAFMLASTNLVIELGIVIAIFLSWQFVVGEYLGGVLLILFMWLFIRLFYPKKLIEQARREQDGGDSGDGKDGKNWREKATSLMGWEMIAKKYVMEWQMVWKDVLIGFTVAGVISAFVPDAFFESLFIGSGGEAAGNPGFGAVLAQVFVGPVAAFFTFIGSMGNIPLAALLYNRGVSFAGVMAFIFSDLVVFPVLRINSKYYGWKMALYILGLLLASLVVVSLLLHYGFLAFDLLPEVGRGSSLEDREFFRLNYGFVLNLIFLAVSGVLVWLYRHGQKGEKHDDHCSDGGHEHHDHGGSSVMERSLQVVSVVAILWLIGGLLIRWFVV